MLTPFGLPLLLAASLAAPRGGDVSRFRTVEGRGLSGNPQAVTDGLLEPVDTEGRAERVAFLADPGSVLVVPLGAERPIRGVVLQAEGEADWMLERSLDGHLWTGLLLVRGDPSATGLKTHAIRYEAPQPARFLLLHAQGGRGRFAVSELAAFDALPTPWPPLEPLPAAPAGAVLVRGVQAAGVLSPVASLLASLTEPRMVAWKALLALSGAALLAWRVRLRRQGRPQHRARLRDTLLAAMGLLAIASWWNFGAFHHRNYTHEWDTFHYYVGAKYYPELGHTGLYRCAVAADLDAGLDPAGVPVPVTDLVTNRIAPVEPAAALAECRALFTPARWSAFVGDVAYFHRHAPGAWRHILTDHGYNATPVWGIAGRALSGLGPATEGRIHALVLLDSLLLLAMWGAVTWAFGWRAAAVAALFWGTNYPARFWWNGGAFLRMDWLVLAVLGVCLLRKERPRLAGVCLAASALLRIFPGAILLGLAAAVVGRCLATRRLAVRPAEWRIAQGAIAAALVLVPLSFLAAGPRGARAWTDFAANSRKHLATPLNNNMGLKTLLAYRPEAREARLVDQKLTEPWAPWKEARLRAERGSRPLLAALVLLALALFGAGFRERPPWVVAAAAVGLVPVATELTCYYYSVFLVLALLWAVREEAGVAIAAFASLSNLVPALLSWQEDRYTLESLLALAAVAFVWAVVLRRPAEARAPLPGAAVRLSPVS